MLLSSEFNGIGLEYAVLTRFSIERGDMADGCQKLGPEPGEHIVLSQKREFFSSYFPRNYAAITSFRVLVGATLIK